MFTAKNATNHRFSGNLEDIEYLRRPAGNALPTIGSLRESVDSVVHSDHFTHQNRHNLGEFWRLYELICWKVGCEENKKSALYSVEFCKSVLFFGKRAYRKTQRNAVEKLGGYSYVSDAYNENQAVLSSLKHALEGVLIAPPPKKGPGDIETFILNWLTSGGYKLLARVFEKQGVLKRNDASLSLFTALPPPPSKKWRQTFNYGSKSSDDIVPYHLQQRVKFALLLRQAKISPFSGGYTREDAKRFFTEPFLPSFSKNATHLLDLKCRGITASANFLFDRELRVKLPKYHELITKLDAPSFLSQANLAVRPEKRAVRQSLRDGLKAALEKGQAFDLEQWLRSKYDGTKTNEDVADAATIFSRLWARRRINRGLQALSRRLKLASISPQVDNGGHHETTTRQWLQRYLR